MGHLLGSGQITVTQDCLLPQEGVLVSADPGFSGRKQPLPRGGSGRRDSLSKLSGTQYICSRELFAEAAAPDKPGAEVRHWPLFRMGRSPIVG